MRKILLIGVGAGNPDYVTIQAVEVKPALKNMVEAAQRLRSAAATAVE